MKISFITLTPTKPKIVQGTNTLAYLASESVKKKKSFITTTPKYQTNKEVCMGQTLPQLNLALSQKQSKNKFYNTDTCILDLHKKVRGTH
jgi:hypothetical protein